MKFVLGIGLLTDVSHAIPLAVEAEKVGFVGDSLYYPKHSVYSVRRVIPGTQRE